MNMHLVSSLTRRFLLVSLVTAAAVTVAQSEPAEPTLKSILLEQLRGTHNQEDWFVPVNIAIQGLTPEQAAWKDQSENHSIVQLVNHLIFRNQQQLTKFKGEKAAPYSGDNKETFSGLDKTTWEASVKQLDEVLVGLQKSIEEA